MSYMSQYHAGTMEILKKLSEECQQIGALGARAAKVINRGGTVWTSMYSGHMPRHEQADERRGNPRVIRSHEDFSMLKLGDLVFTNFCNVDVLSARERGVYVVCVTTPYQNNEFRPANFTDLSHGNPDGLMLEDVSNEILHTHMPYQQGLVACPQIPEFTLCPCASTGSGAVHWMLNAETATKLADPSAEDGKEAHHYLKILTDRVAQTANHMPSLQATTRLMTERILAGGHWFARSVEHPGFETEFNVASGPRIVNYGEWEGTKRLNIMLISAVSPAFQAEVDLANEKMAEGAYVIGIGPVSLDGGISTPRLLEIANVPFDNFSPESGGVIGIPGRAQTICPTSGIVGNIIQQMISAQWAEEMIKAGAIPTFYRGVYQSGGREYNDRMSEIFEQRGY